MNTLKVALAGQPNCGKSSLFNLLTGEHQKVGNYPGVTVEQHVGHAKFGEDFTVELHDLPGIYSLSSFSPEERIARDELLKGQYDVAVFVADSTSLKRSLVFLTHLMQLDLKLVLCLNMTDEARKAGQKLDVQQMELLLGFPVVQTSAHHPEGIDALRNAIVTASKRPVPQSRLKLGDRLDTALADVKAALGDGEITGYSKTARAWFASRILVDDTELPINGPTVAQAKAVAAKYREQIEAETGMDMPLFVTHSAFGFVDGLMREVLLQESRPDARATSDRIDKILAHRWLGLPIFAAVMYALFWLTFTVGDPFMGLIEDGFSALGEFVTSLFSNPDESLLCSLLVDGIIGGVGGVIVFLPNILLLFFGLSFLEDTGYLSRAAFLVDRLMHKFGLHGKSFVPMLTGFGCSVPGIMATRTLENDRDRLTTMMVLPLMSCGARLPIWMLLIPVFFAEKYHAAALFGIYGFGILLALVLALCLRKTFFRGEDAPFVMELPPYRLPTFRAMIRKMFERGWLYLKKAGTIILAVSIALWVATTFPKTTEFEVDQLVEKGSVVVVADTPDGEEPSAEVQALIAQAEKDGKTVMTESDVENVKAEISLKNSIAGRVGQAIEPVLQPMGFDWRIGTALIGAFAAKEVFVAQMGIVYSMGETDEESDDLRERIRKDYNPAIGIALMLFLLISAPCMATIAVTRREANSWKWALMQLGGLTAVAYVIATVVYQVGRLFL